MRLFEKQRALVVGLIFLSAFLVLSAYGQSWVRRPRIPADSSGLKAELEALTLRVAALESQVVTLKAGQLNLTSWEHIQLAAQILEVGQYPVGRGVWVCDLSETNGERLATQAEFLNDANVVKNDMEAQMILLQP